MALVGMALPSSERERLTMGKLPKKQLALFLYIRQIWKIRKNLLPIFPSILKSILITLPADTFLHVLRTNLNTHLINLWLTTESQQEGLGFGNEPDGYEIEWRPERKNDARVESILFKINPRLENDESVPSLEVEQQEFPPATSGAVDTAKLVSAINRLFWAVVIIAFLYWWF